MSERSWPELLSGKPLCEFSPEEYREYIRSLFYKKPPKPTGKKRLRDLKVSVRKLKKGGLSVTTKRSPKYVTREEYDALAKLHPENELFIALKAAGFLTLSSHEEAEKILRDQQGKTT